MCQILKSIDTHFSYTSYWKGNIFVELLVYGMKYYRYKFKFSYLLILINAVSNVWAIVTNIETEKKDNSVRLEFKMNWKRYLCQKLWNLFDVKHLKLLSTVSLPHTVPCPIFKPNSNHKGVMLKDSKIVSYKSILQGNTT